MSERPLNLAQQKFVEELFLVENFNASLAYERAYGCDSESARSNATRLMSDPRIQDAIEKKKKELRDSMPLTAADVVRHISELANANPRDLIEFFVGACRYCHGIGFKYQRTPAEFEREYSEYQKARKAAVKRGECEPDPLGLEFDQKGGVGFSRKREPHPGCPECDGLGEGYEVPKDTRTLSPAAARLYAGVKRTKNGLEFNMRSQDKALQLAGSHLGLWKDVKEVSGPGGTPLVPSDVSVKHVVDATEAAQIYQKLMG